MENDTPVPKCLYQNDHSERPFSNERGRENEEDRYDPGNNAPKNWSNEKELEQREPLCVSVPFTSIRKSFLSFFARVRWREGAFFTFIKERVSVTRKEEKRKGEGFGLSGGGRISEHSLGRGRREFPTIYRLG